MKSNLIITTFEGLKKYSVKISFNVTCHNITQLKDCGVNKKKYLFVLIFYIIVFETQKNIVYRCTSFGNWYKWVGRSLGVL